MNVLQDAIEADSYMQPAKTLQNGDLDAGFKQADHVVEGEVFVVDWLILYNQENARSIFKQSDYNALYQRLY